MTRLSAIPKTASLEFQKSGRIVAAGGKNDGKQANIKLYVANQGGHTIKRFFVIRIDNEKEMVFSYSGKNFAESLNQFNSCAEIIS